MSEDDRDVVTATAANASSTTTTPIGALIKYT
jgi:hypothetical protein